MIAIEQHVLEIIEDGNTKGNLYFLPNQQLDRKTYLAANKVLECLGGKWNRKLKAHLFESDISDAIDNVLLTGEVVDKKKEFQFFETPQHVVTRIIELAEIWPSHRCLEPSAGHGNIAEALRDIVGNDSVTCVELDPGNAEILTNKGFQVWKGGFLQYDADYKYDRIVMNPPFTRQQDIAHVQYALLHLGDSGILVSVMSAGVVFRQNKKTLDFWEQAGRYKHEVIQLPPGAFKISGTMVNVVIVKIEA